MKKTEQSTKKRNKETIQVLLRFHTNDSEKTEDLKNNLKSQLIEYDDVKVLKLESETLPDGAMSSDAFTIGALALVVLPTLIPTIINAVKDIRLKNKGASVSIKVKDGEKEIQLQIPADAISVEEIKVLIDEYLEKFKV